MTLWVFPRLLAGTGADCHELAEFGREEDWGGENAGWEQEADFGGDDGGDGGGLWDVAKGLFSDD